MDSGASKVAVTFKNGVGQIIDVIHPLKPYEGTANCSYQQQRGIIVFTAVFEQSTSEEVSLSYTETIASGPLHLCRKGLKEERKGETSKTTEHCENLSDSRC